LVRTKNLKPITREEEHRKMDYFIIANEVINKAYPDFHNKGAGWWGMQKIPNFGILRGAIVAALKKVEGQKLPRFKYLSKSISDKSSRIPF
jgi:hypothetical protein